MPEYRLKWCRYPYNYNDPHVIFVEAANPEDAMHIAQDHIERHFGIPKDDFGISHPNPKSRNSLLLGAIEEAVKVTHLGKVVQPK